MGLDRGMVEVCWGEVLGGWGLGVGMLVELVGREVVVVVVVVVGEYGVGVDVFVGVGGWC